MQLNYTRFADVANAIMGRTLNPPFDAFKDDISFLIAVYIFEDVGVSAYRVRGSPTSNPKSDSDSNPIPNPTQARSA